MKWMNPIRDAEVSSFLHKLEAQLYRLEDSTDDALRRMKRLLHDYSDTIPPKLQKYPNAVTFNINRQIAMRASESPRHNRRKHKLSDHAFVRVLELIHNLNIDELKAKAIRDVEQSDEFEPLYKDKRIVTILRKAENNEQATQEQDREGSAYAEVQDARRAG